MRIPFGSWALPEGVCVAVIVNFEAERDKQPDALDRLTQLIKDDLERVNELILANMQSPVALIPQLAGHIIAAGGKRLRPVLTLAAAKLCGYHGPRSAGLAACVDPSALTVIGNTGDDEDIWGLHVSPDLDSVMYALAGVLDTQRGWGRADETFHCLAAMAGYGAPTWFALGDRDLATHIARTQALAAGASLSAVTARLARGLGVSARLLPMSDDCVRTLIRTPEGTT